MIVLFENIMLSLVGTCTTQLGQAMTQEIGNLMSSKVMNCVFTLAI